MSMMTDAWSRWRSRAACQGTDLTLWYGPPEPGDGPDGRAEPVAQRRWRERRAKRICASCPVQAPCLAEELVRPMEQQWGLRGGLTGHQRRQLIKALRERRWPARGPAAAA